VQRPSSALTLTKCRTLHPHKRHPLDLLLLSMIKMKTFFSTIETRHSIAHQTCMSLSHVQTAVHYSLNMPCFSPGRHLYQAIVVSDTTTLNHLTNNLTVPTRSFQIQTCRLWRNSQTRGALPQNTPTTPPHPLNFDNYSSRSAPYRRSFVNG